MTTSFRNLRDSRPTITPASRLFPAARAFTLIELLVVIAIVAVLAALLLPVVTKASMAGKQAQSIARIRDLQRANIQFASEHNQSYVPTQFYQDTPFVDQFWFTWSDFLNYFDNTKGHYWYWGNSPENVYSPLIPLNVSQSMGTSYGMNGWTYTQGRQMSRDVPVPSKMMAFIESQDFYVWNDGAKPGKYQIPEKWSWTTVAYRYNNKTNAVFFDGHVETLEMKDIVDNTLFWSGTGVPKP